MDRSLPVLLLALLAGPAAAQGTLSSESGRFVLGQLSESRRDQFLLDTQTGRLWQVVYDSTGQTLLRPVVYGVTPEERSLVPLEPAAEQARQDSFATNLLSRYEDRIKRYRDRWGEVREGMSGEEVRALVGEPLEVVREGRSYRWMYPHLWGGHVEFRSGRVASVVQ